MKSNYGLRRLFSVCLVIALFFSLLSQSEFEVHAEENNFKKVTFSLDSNVIHNSSIDLYLHEDVYYISIDDLCSLTRCSQSEEDGIISINQGFWSAEFDINAQTFDDGYQKVDDTILEISKNKYAVPAVMFLNYFKASVAFIEGDKLFCKMPEFTAWEALDVNFKDTLIDIYELYGGEGNVELSLWLDIIMDFIMGDMADSEKYLSDAFVAALEVEINDNDSVKDYKETMVQKLYSELHSEQSEDFLESLKDRLSISAEPSEWYIESYYNAVEKSFVKLAYDANEAGNYDEIKNYGKGFYDAFAEKNKVTKGAKEFFKNMDYLMVFISAASETAKEMKYVNATNDLVYNVMGQENLQYLGISADDNLWFTVANKYQNVLNVGKKQLESEIINFLIDKSCWETAISGAVINIEGVSKGSGALALSISRIIAKNINPITKGIIDGFKADRRGLYLSELQQNVFWVLDNTAKKFDGQLDNKDIYEKYIQAEQLYCRTSIAMYKNLIKMVKQFGKDSDYWTDYFQKRIDMLAISLYQLTSLQDDGVINCLPLDLSTFSQQSVSNIDHIKFNSMDWDSYAKIYAYNKNGDIVWEYTTPKYEPTELVRVSEIGQRDNMYFFIQGGSVVALDVSTGKIIWENNDFGGASPSVALGEKAIYMCGYYGPDFYAISYDGKTLYRIDDFDQDSYWWAGKIEIIEKDAVVYLYGSSNGYLGEEPKTFYVDLNTYDFHS